MQWWVGFVDVIIIIGRRMGSDVRCWRGCCCCLLLAAVVVVVVVVAVR